MTLPIEKILVLSTAHLEESVAKALPDAASSDDARANQRDAMWHPTWTRPEGWMFYVPPRGIEDHRYDDAPHCLKACANLAREVGCVWLMFDCDAMRIDGLPTWEW